MSIATTNEQAEAEIRELVSSFLEALRASDVDRIMAHYAPEIVAFDAIRELQFKGIEAYRKQWEWCVSYCPGSGGTPKMEIHDLKVVANGDVAFSHHLNNITMKLKDGEVVNFWNRITACYRRIDGEWKIVHDHCSHPMEPETGKALFEAKP